MLLATIPLASNFAAPSRTLRSALYTRGMASAGHASGRVRAMRHFAGVDVYPLYAGRYIGLECRKGSMGPGEGT